MQDTQPPVRIMHFQLEASMHSYGALPTPVLSKTYSGVYQLKYEPTQVWEKHNWYDASLPAKGSRQ